MANFLAGFEIEMVPTLDSSVVGRTHSIYYNSKFWSSRGTAGISEV